MKDCRCNRRNDPFAWIRGRQPVTSFSDQPATVLTVTGAFASVAIPTIWMRGELWAPPNRYKVMPYSNFIPDAGAVEDGMEALDVMLHDTVGRIIVYGFSMGSQLIDKWLREIGPTSDLDVARVSFVTAGNPERKYGGICVNDPTHYPALFGGTGPPEDTTFKVIDFARQYDFYADHPNDLDNDAAQQNLGGLFGPVHVDYWTQALSDPQNVRWTEDNITYVLSPTKPCPFVAWWGIFGAAVLRSKDIAYRPTVESAYTRPVPLPSPY